MKIVLVTGGTRGLGLAIATTLSEAGYQTIITGRSMSEGAKELVGSYSNASFEPFDFRNIDEIHSFASVISKKYGRLYALINNAAIGSDGVLATMHETDITSVIRINIEAPILLTKYLIRPMLINRSGRVINISSIIGSTGFKGLSVYGATKAALNGFTKSLSREVGRAGITVNSVAPGYMETEMTEGLDEKKLASIKGGAP